MDQQLQKSGRAELSRSWLWALCGSLALHGMVALAAVAWQQSEPPEPRRVIPVEIISLEKAQPAPAGGGGEPAPKIEPPAPAPPKAPARVARPRPAPTPRPRPRPTRAERPTPPQPPPDSLALTRPDFSASSSASGSTTGGVAAGTAGGQGAGGSGGGTGGGRGSGRGTGEGPGAGTGDILQGYLHEVRRLLERQKDYPMMARRTGTQGVAVLQFTIAADGTVGGADLRRSSGHRMLDRAAQDTVKRVGRFPPLPSALGKERLTIEIPLAFRLHDR